MTQAEPQFIELKPRKIGRINKIGLFTLVKKEVDRFLNVYMQTIVAPVVTSLLFFCVFALAFGGIQRVVGDLPYLEFLAPGLIMMTMAQNAFANSSSSLGIAKIQGSIVDILMPPLSPMELFLGYMIGAMLRGLLLGTVFLVVISFFVHIPISNPVNSLIFAFLGTYLMAALGIGTGIWAEKFDQMATVTNFFITPLTFLSGTFYTMDRLPEFWRNLAYYDPFFYMIDGFRSGFIGHSEGGVMTGMVVLLVADILLTFAVLQMLKSGYKIKS